ncbi:MAG: GNAT family N-acetyltransferase [Candidatus Moranbacteria bacterium]|nr:GNAT family N-acetyltransferase [Candidatus Moranbacteria bacterium]
MAIEADPSLDPRNSEYTKIALSSENGLDEAIKRWKRDNAESVLFENHILERDGDTIILADAEKLKSEGWRKWNGKQTTTRDWELIPAIRKRFDIPDSESRVYLKTSDIFDRILHLPAAKKDGSGDAMPITTFPDSFDQMVSGKYPDCHVKPWELAAMQRDIRENTVTLADGTVTSIAELSMADFVREWKVTSIGNGRFSLTDPASGETIQLGTEQLTKEFLSAQGYRSAMDFRYRPAEYAKEHLGNLHRLGILRPEDFRQTVARFDDSLFPPQDRSISSSPDMSLQTPGGKSMKYYLGRNTIVGTDIPFDRESMVLRYLDDRTCGLVRIVGNAEEVVTTFPLLSPDEVEERREITKQRLAESGKSVTEKNIASYAYAGGKEMSRRMKRHQLTQYLPQLPDESPRDYANRIARLSDIRLTSQNTREFFRDANIGLHHLPWEEQLAASSILIDHRFNREKILEFCKRFGKDGLRTFIASTFGKDINHEVFSFGSDEPELAESIFHIYASMLSSRDAFSETLDRFRGVGAATAEQFSTAESAIKSSLTTKAKTFLEKFFSEYSTIKHRGHDAKKSLINSFSEKFKTVRSDIEMFKSAFRTLYEEGVIENFEDVSGMEFGTKSPEELSDEDKEAMRRIYDENYPESAGYSKEFREAIFHGLEDAFTKKDTRFYVLKKDGEMVGYNRFENLPDTEDERKRKYVGSFNVAPHYRGSKLGDKLFDDCLAQETIDDTIIEAYADPTLPISSHYLETNGFVATGIEDIGGRPLLKIMRDPETNARLATKQSPQDKEELTRLAEKGHISIRKMPRGDIPAIASDLLGKGWLLTHITRDTGDNSAVAAVFEKPR